MDVASSDYVKARVKLLRNYFRPKGWIVSEGMNDTVLIYVSSEEPIPFDSDELMSMIRESDHHCKPTGLKMAFISYRFYHRSIFVNRIDV
jgi:hypothetical protein